MLTIRDLTVAYGTKKLIENANLQLYKNQIVGLVGQNGTGKTSLFKIILGNHAPEAGECNIPANTLVSHIEQEINDLNQPLIEYVLLAHYVYREEHIDLPEYYQLRPRAEKLLINLGFLEAELENPLTHFSGGWQMRANLAKALFCPSDLLLLDEPTNHLDIETVIWLENWLKSYSGLALIISHDREFLDNVTKHTVHISGQKLNLYGGNYSTFTRTYAEQLELEQKNAAKTEAKIAHLQKFVDRFKAKASKAKQAQSRMKMIEKLQFSPTFNSNKNYSIDFFKPEYASDLLLSATDVVVGYPDKQLIENLNLQVFTNDRIGLLGRNGKGKTSLIKAIIDQTSLLAGNIYMNNKIRIGYFAQQTVDMLSDDDTPFSIIKNTNPAMKEQEIYNYLGRFGFAADLSKNQVANFSGGEKARLILASIILTKPNILFLDEPTNHLDMQMREELAASLQEFEGAVILVSHDKFLLESVADDFYLIENNQLNKFGGSLDDYQNYLLNQAKEDNSKRNLSTSKGKNKIANRQPSQNLLQELEKQITQLSALLITANQELDMANAQNNLTDLVMLSQKIEKLENELKAAESKWLELQI